jgi:hypothetical protein
MSDRTDTFRELCSLGVERLGILTLNWKSENYFQSINEIKSQMNYLGSARSSGQFQLEDSFEHPFSKLSSNGPMIPVTYQTYGKMQM